MTMKKTLSCPRCGEELASYRNPLPTADVIIELDGKGIILIMRKNEPRGWAIPGGFVDYGESLEDAAIREAKEETGLDIALTGQLHTYSKPERDQRYHTITTVYTATASGTPVAADDAVGIGIFTESTLPSPLMFDHAQILADYFRRKREPGNGFS